jgi:hypothetical protein
VVTAAVWLSNAPAAVVVSYALALILAVMAARERSLRPLIYGGGALALGLALAAFYIVPAAFEQSWVNIAEVLSPGLQFGESFLFTRTADAEHTRFNFIVSRVAVEVIVVTIGAMVASRRWRQVHPRLGWMLLAVAAVSTILMFPLSSPAWTYLPKLRYVQFPWRWLLVLDVPFALCLAAALERLRGASKRAAWAVVLAGLALTGFLLTRSNWWDPGGVAAFYEEHFSTGAGYFGTDEYGPRGSDHYDLDPHAPQVSLRRGKNPVAESGTRSQVYKWGAIRKEFVVHSPEPVTAALRLVNYPAWRVEVDGRRVPALSSQQTGQMLVALPAGTSRVQVAFVATPDRLWGDAASAAAALGLLAVVLASRRRGRASTVGRGMQPARP